MKDPGWNNPLKNLPVRIVRIVLLCRMGRSTRSFLNLRRVITRHTYKNQYVTLEDEFYTSILTCFNTSILTSNYS